MVVENSHAHVEKRGIGRLLEGHALLQRDVGERQRLSLGHGDDDERPGTWHVVERALPLAVSVRRVALRDGVLVDVARSSPAACLLESARDALRRALHGRRPHLVLVEQLGERGRRHAVAAVRVGDPVGDHVADADADDARVLDGDAPLRGGALACRVHGEFGDLVVLGLELVRLPLGRLGGVDGPEARVRVARVVERHHLVQARELVLCAGPVPSLRVVAVEGAAAVGGVLLVVPERAPAVRVAAWPGGSAVCAGGPSAGSEGGVDDACHGDGASGYGQHPDQ